MKFYSRRPEPAPQPGVTGTARVADRPTALLSRLRAGDVAVLDHVDLDSETAAAMVTAQVGAVVNASPMISGRYVSLGPEVLAVAGVVLVDQVDPLGLAAIRDDQTVRVHDGTVYVDDEAVATGRTLDLDTVRAEMTQARSGLLVQLDTLTHSTSEFLRREQELLLDGRGLPDLTTPLSGRTVVVACEPNQADLTSIRRLLRDQDPVIIAVGRAADDLLGLSWPPAIVIVTADDPPSVPSAEALRVANDVVVLARRGASTAEHEAVQRLGLHALHVESSATAEDVALLLAERHDAALIVGVGLHARLEDFLDNKMAGRASTFATRLKVGSRLIDARAVEALYAPPKRILPVVLLVLAVLVTMVTAVAVTPVGQEWIGDLGDLLDDLRGRL